MPIEAYFLPDGESEIQHFATVEPGDSGIFIDRSLSAGEYIVAACRKDDFGGSVHIIETGLLLPDGAEEEEFEQLQLKVTLDDANRVQKICNAVEYQRSIVDYYGECGRLLLQHEQKALRTLSKIFFAD